MHTTFVPAGLGEGVAAGVHIGLFEPGGSTQISPLLVTVLGSGIVGLVDEAVGAVVVGAPSALGGRGLLGKTEFVTL